jgi:hypothetical protein
MLFIFAISYQTTFRATFSDCEMAVMTCDSNEFHLFQSQCFLTNRVVTEFSPSFFVFEKLVVTVLTVTSYNRLRMLLRER